MRIRGMLTIAAIVLIATVAAPLRAQPRDVRFNHLSVEHGLSGAAVSTILQDRAGFMWIGTHHGGLHKYDGYAFTVYKHDPDNPNSLSSDRIEAVYEDANGILWIGTWDGLDRLDPTTGTFTHFQHDPLDPNSIGKGIIMAVQGDKRGFIWIGTWGGGLTRFHPAIGVFTPHRHDPADRTSLNSDFVSAIYEDRAGMLWIGTPEGLAVVDPVSLTLKRYVHDPADRSSLSSNLITSIGEDLSGDLWIGTRSDGLSRMQRASGSFTGYRHDATDHGSLGSNHIREIFVDRSGAVWISTYDAGIDRFDVHSGTFTHYRHDPHQPASLSSNNAGVVYEDDSGTLWVSTLEGLNKSVRGAEAAFHFVSLQDGANDSGGRTSSSLHTGDIYTDRSGGLWIAAWSITRSMADAVEDGGGLRRIDPVTGAVTHYRHNPNNPNSLSSNHVWAAREDRSGMIWIGTDRGGLNRLDPRTGTIMHFRHDPEDPESLSHDEILVIHEESSGFLALGTGNGLSRFDPETGLSMRYFYSTDEADRLLNTVTAILEDREGSLWIGTVGAGLARLDPASGAIDHYRHDPHRLNSLPSDVIHGLLEDRSGLLWVATAAGLARFDPKAQQFRRFTEQNSGLADNAVYAVLEDDEGDLWIKTAAGISRFDPHATTFRTYAVDTRALLPASAAHKSPSGALLFGGRSGYLTFVPGEVVDNPHAPRVVVTEFRLFNEPALNGAVLHLGGTRGESAQISLRHDENDLTFVYAALHYANSARNQYAYMLEGFEEDWRYVGTQRAAIYPRLPPGRYRFRVKAANSDGVWNETGAAVGVIILPPWWQSIWFRLVAVLAVIGVMTAAFRLRIHSIKARSEKLEALVAERTLEVERQKAQLVDQANRLVELDHAKSRFFANISHEFRTPLTLILGPVESALQNFYGDMPERLRWQLVMVRRQAAGLLQLVNQILDLARIESGRLQLQAERQDLVPLVRSCVRSFTAHAERRGVSLTFIAREPRAVLRFDREKLQTVIGNLLSNAFKFTPSGGKVWVSVSSTESSEVGAGSFVEIIVKDTGSGIPEEALEAVFDRFVQVDGSSSREHESTGIGLALAKELVELHGGKILVESELGFGTAFTIRLPVHVDEALVDGAAAERRDDDAGRETAGDGEAAAAGGEFLPVSREDRRIEYEITPNAFAAEPPTMDASARPALLLVEDNAELRGYLRDQLSPDYRILEAADGEAALQFIRDDRPDFVLSDVMIPKMDGYSLCRMLKGDESLRHIPIVLLTARASEADAVYAFESGADDFVTKPFSMAELRMRITHLLLSRRLLREKFSRETVVRPSDIVIQSSDEVFLRRVLDVVEVNMSDHTFGVDALADDVGLSRRQLERRVRAVCGETPGEVIRRLRLERAAQYLKAESGTVAEIAFSVGYQSPSHFSTAYRRHFGTSPSERVDNAT